MYTRFTFASALLLLLFGSGCELTSTDDRKADGDFDVSTIETLPPSEWGSGVFYIAEEPVIPRDISLDDVQAILRTAISQGAPVEAAWFVESRAMCCPPGNVCLTVVVTPKLVIRLSRSDRVPALEGFTLEAHPDLFCPHYVHKLVPVED